ncbi:unnamed protein product, partial [Rotaria sp. Silwood1]
MSTPDSCVTLENLQSHPLFK